MKTQKILGILFIASLCLFYMLNHYTNIAIDDYAYKHIVTNDVSEKGQRVQTIFNLIISQYNHYFLINGRLLMNGLAQVFLMSDNKTWFNIANVLMFGLLQLLVFFIVGIKRKDITIRLYIYTLLLLWFLIPAPNHTLLWLTGSFNYLWAIVFGLVFLYLHNQLISSKKNFYFFWYPIFFFIGFLTAATHEVISLGIAGALFFRYVFNIKKFKGVLIPLVIGFFIGVIFIALAPGNIVRLQGGNSESQAIYLIIIKRIAGFVMNFKSLAAFWLMIVAFMVLYFKDRNGLKDIYKKNELLIHSIFISLIFIVLVGAFLPRVFFGISIFSVIILISIVHKYKYLFFSLKLTILYTILFVFMIVEYSNVAIELRENKIAFDKDEELWLTSNDNVFELSSKITNRFSSFGLGKSDRYFWSNKHMSWYYGKEFIMFVPFDLYQNVYATNKLIANQNLLSLKTFEKIVVTHCVWQRDTNGIYMVSRSD